MSNFNFYPLRFLVVSGLCITFLQIAVESFLYINRQRTFTQYLCFCKPTFGLVYLLRLVTNHYLRRELASDENKCIFSLRTYPLKSINISKRLFRVEVSSFLMQTKFRFLILYSQVNRFRLRHNVIKIDRNILIYRLKVFSTKRQLAKSRLYPYFVIMSFNYGVQNVHIIRSKFRTATR